MSTRALQPLRHVVSLLAAWTAASLASAMGVDDPEWQLALVDHLTNVGMAVGLVLFFVLEFVMRRRKPDPKP